MVSLPPPIPGRECGECTACCTDLKIEELHKEDEVPCVHLRTDGAGCSIYEQRPATCRHWVCGWRLVRLSDAMRPDRCGIMLAPELTDLPGYAKGGLKLVFTNRNPPRPLPDEMVDFAGQMIAANVPLFVTYGQGVFSKRLLLNDLMIPMVRQGDRAGFVNAMNVQLTRLRQVVETAMAQAG